MRNIAVGSIILICYHGMLLSGAGLRTAQQIPSEITDDVELQAAINLVSDLMVALVASLLLVFLFDMPYLHFCHFEHNLIVSCPLRLLL